MIKSKMIKISIYYLLLTATTLVKNVSSFDEDVYVYSLVPSPPTPRWKTKVPGPLERGNAVTVSPDDSLVFAITSTCVVVALDPITGEEVSSFTTSRSNAGIPDASSETLDCESGVVFYSGEDATSSNTVTPYLVFTAKISFQTSLWGDNEYYSHVLALSYPDLALKWVSPRLDGRAFGAGTPVISSDGKYVFTTHNTGSGWVGDFTASFTILNASDGTVFYQEQSDDKPWGPPGLYPNPSRGFYPGGQDNTNDLVAFACSHPEYGTPYWDPDYAGCLYIFQFPVGFDGTSTDGLDVIRVFDEDYLSGSRWPATNFPPAIGLEGLSLYFSMSMNQVLAWYGDDPNDESLMFHQPPRYSKTLSDDPSSYIDQPPNTRPVFNNDESQVYVVSQDDIIHALDADLTENFKMAGFETVVSAVLPSPDNSIVFFADKYVHGHSAVNGNEFFQITTPSWRIDADMSTDSLGETLYFGDTEGNVIAVDLTPFSCVGDRLDEVGVRSLGRGEFICTNDNNDRFGLSQDGLLIQVRNRVVNWNSGLKGSTLFMQIGDGNLVLRDESGSAVWSTGCPSPGANLVFDKDNDGVTLVAQDDTIVWRVWESGRASVCFPGDTAPVDQGPYKCMSDKLHIGNLLRGEYLCGPSGYRFGVSPDGMLGEWRNFDLEGFAPEYDLLLWSPGDYRADRLKMQADGNLVLKDEGGGVLWATQCPAPSGESVVLRELGFVNDGGGIRIVVDGSNEIIWRVWDNGLEAECGQSLDPPSMTCKGLQLGQADMLGTNEYICENPKDDTPEDSFQGHRFGLNDRGQLVLWDGFKTIWSPGFAIQGDTLRIDDSALQLQAGGSAAWSSCTISEDTTLQLKSRSVQLVDSGGHVYWYVDYETGTESDCDPTNVPQELACPAEASEPETDCRMRVVDLVNPKYIELTIERFTDIYTAHNTFEITNKDNDCSTDWRVEGTIHENGFIDIVEVDVEGNERPGHKYGSCTDLGQNYVMMNSSDFLFVEVPNYPCTQFAKDLVYYAVHEVLEALDPAIIGTYSEY